MPNQQLLDYIRQQAGKGVPAGDIKQALLTAGWQEADVDEAFASMENPEPALAYAPAIPGKLPGSMELFKRSWEIFKSKFWTLLGIIFLPALIVIISVAAFAAFFLASNVTIGMDNLIDLLPIILIGLFVFLIAASVQFWSQIALLYAIKDPDKKIGVKEAYRLSYPKIMPYWWIGFLQGLIIFGGLLFLIVPGFIFAVWLCLATYILVAEDIGGMNALLKSKFYVQDRWGFVCGKLSFLIILSFGLAILISILTAIIPEAQNLTNIIVQALMTPIASIYLFLTYKALKDSKAGVEYKPAGKGLLIAAAIFGLIAVPAFFLTVGLAIPSLTSVAPSAARNAQVMSYMSMVKATAMVYANSNSAGYSYDGMDKDPEYLSVCENLGSIGSSCSAQIEKSSYCVKAKLIKDSSFSAQGKDYWCVDSNGEEKAINGGTYCTEANPFCSLPE
ncbi:MAG: hypothetical protein WC926_05040 [Candidatus Paceibacterota bacterium]|jgi:hypothetical protein